ncbi:methyltransferase domain-containing protein [Nocardioides sp. zg-ZUI104]|uniref:LicD family protein n=1 Tax=Nocardioides faecalis TaxID=2803858 RepID=UPI001BCB1974|nr:LicD family protein [Nocardioides faecalis]MBS4752642.1 methyltransferase domain-containing protein [Nocardioides faecalis]
MPAADRRGTTVSRLRVDDAGLTLQATDDVPVNVLFDDQRVFSFWLLRDTEERDGERFLAWPPVLRGFLSGAVRVGLADPSGDEGSTWAEVEAVLGDGEGRVAVRDKQGNPMGLDKSMRLMRLFADRDPDQLRPLQDAIEIVAEALRRAGLEPFVAYGTLLGAVRDGDFIGHDSDADLGYVSRFEYPVDVTAESFRVQRDLEAMGYRVQRYSGLGLKVMVEEGDGTSRGLDVFGGFLRDGQLYLMGEVGHPFQREWIFPLGTAELAGRSVPVPAEPERLLEVMYGPGWRKPDPAFKFGTPTSVRRRLDGWFRGTRHGLDERWVRERTGDVAKPKSGPSRFARWVAEREPDAVLAVDVGCGRGHDAVWLAGQGHRAVGVDYFPPDLRRAQRLAQRRGADAAFRWTSLTELRSVLETGAALATEPGPRIVLARHVLEATNPAGRRNLLLLARMLTRDQGRAYLQVIVEDGEAAHRRGLQPVGVGELERLVAASGGGIEELVRLSTAEAELPLAPGEGHLDTVRMVVSWHR